MRLMDFTDRRWQLVAGAAAVLVLAVGGLVALMGGPSDEAIRLAASGEPDDRLEAVGEFRGDSSDAARRMLVKLARDANAHVARSAVRAIDEMDTLSRIAQDREFPASARGVAAARLGRYEGTAPCLLTNMLAKDPAVEVRAGAARGLSRLRKHETIPELVAALEDPSSDVRLWAITAIHSMIVCRFPYDATLPTHHPQNRDALRQLRAYLETCGVLSASNPQAFRGVE